MDNAFAALGLEPRLSLDEESIRAAYLERSKTALEDDQQVLNEALQLLLPPDRRVKHLMDISAPAEAKAWRTVPLSDDYMRLFGVVGNARQQADPILKKAETSQSALARALLAPQILKVRDQAEEAASQLESALESELTKLPDLDAKLAGGQASAPWSEVAEVQARLAYLLKWQAQIRESLMRLQPG
ncbi:MAG: hypothetical protein JNJ83_09065 [Verrucomicrobiaceae bacterium]|nr:hypothetical protein [Verrucomicrobiaceae bacterium]